MNIKVSDFEEKWLDDLAYEFYKFNRNNPMKLYSEIKHIKSFSLKLQYFKEKLLKMLDFCDYNFIAIDKNKNKIYAFTCYEIKKGVCLNYFIFKSVDYPMDRDMFKTHLKFFDKMREKGFTKIEAYIDRVYKDPLLKFVERYYGANAEKQEEGNDRIVFDLEKNTRWRFYLDK